MISWNQALMPSPDQNAWEMPDWWGIRCPACDSRVKMELMKIAPVGTPREWLCGSCHHVYVAWASE